MENRAFQYPILLSCTTKIARKDLQVPAFFLLFKLYDFIYNRFHQNIKISLENYSSYFTSLVAQNLNLLKLYTISVIFF